MTLREDGAKKAIKLTEAIILLFRQDAALLHQAPEIIANVESILVEMVIAEGASLEDAAYLAACFEAATKLVVDRMLTRLKMDRDRFMVAKLGWDIQLAAKSYYEELGDSK